MAIPHYLVLHATPMTKFYITIYYFWHSLTQMSFIYCHLNFHHGVSLYGLIYLRFLIRPKQNICVFALTRPTQEISWMTPIGWLIFFFAVLTPLSCLRSHDKKSTVGRSALFFFLFLFFFSLSAKPEIVVPGSAIRFQHFLFEISGKSSFVL
jgi:hypothetical protein